MAHKAPGRAYRQGMTVMELFRRFPDNEAAERWFEAQRWPEGRFCPDCGSPRTAVIASRRPMPYRCKDCRRFFSVRKGTVMESSKLGLQKWAIALYLMTTNLKGVSSMKLYREVGIRQGTAWFLMQRIREGFDAGTGRSFPGPVEVDETFIGGRERNKHESKKLKAGRGAVGKAAVVGAKQRGGAVTAQHVAGTDRAVMRSFIEANVEPGAILYSDDSAATAAVPDMFNRLHHEAVNHSAGEYVRGQAHTNGIESFWAMLKRGYQGTYHKMSVKHLGRYVNEFAGRHNIRDLDTLDQMAALARGFVGQRLRYQDLIAAVAPIPADGGNDVF